MTRSGSQIETPARASASLSRPGLFFSVIVFAGATLALTALPACKKSGTPADPVARGKQVYISNCISCHNVDPRKPGVIGPEIWGSSLELLKARVLDSKYPEGYKPKRETRTMPMFPNLNTEIEALHSFLNAQ